MSVQKLCQSRHCLSKYFLTLTLSAAHLIASTLSYERQRQQIAPTHVHLKEQEADALIMVLDAVNVGLRGRIRLSFLTIGFSCYNCWRNRPYVVEGAAVNSFSLW